jgi:hypothetical protein
MNEDYLWDRTGERDAELQELEDVLATLRYQPRPLVLPADVQPTSRRWFSPALAIAAMILLAMVAAGLWLGLRRQQTSHPEIGMTPARPSERQDQSLPKAKIVGDQKPAVQSPALATNQNPTLQKTRTPRNAAKRNPPLNEMTAAQRAEGEAAKEQLLLALRVASLKLNIAQRKNQGPAATNNIRNQHKLG